MIVFWHPRPRMRSALAARFIKQAKPGTRVQRRRGFQKRLRAYEKWTRSPEAIEFRRQTLEALMSGQGGSIFGVSTDTSEKS